MGATTTQFECFSCIFLWRVALHLCSPLKQAHTNTYYVCTQAHKWSLRSRIGKYTLIQIRIELPLQWSKRTKATYTKYVNAYTAQIQRSTALAAAVFQYKLTFASGNINSSSSRRFDWSLATLWALALASAQRTIIFPSHLSQTTTTTTSTTLTTAINKHTTTPKGLLLMLVNLGKRRTRKKFEVQV